MSDGITPEAETEGVFQRPAKGNYEQVALEEAVADIDGIKDIDDLAVHQHEIETAFGNLRHSHAQHAIGEAGIEPRPERVGGCRAATTISSSPMCSNISMNPLACCGGSTRNG
jgi:hypothetical protein